ncbi:MAG: FAD binding domain-containing protein [Candidatus Thorarchaeota archaeon]
MIETVSHVNLPKFKVIIPNSIEETLELLHIHQTDCKILAGGTDLLVELRHRLIQPNVIIDIKNIEELNKIEFTDEGLQIGAAVPIFNVLKTSQVETHYTALYQALSDMCDEILRMRATIAGNIATASPAADTAGPLYVHQATVEVQSQSKGSRLIQINEFFKGVKKSNLAPDELIVSIKLPSPSPNFRSAFMKMKRGKEDLALVGVAGAHNPQNTYLAFTAVAPTPIFLDISPFNIKEKITDDLFQSVWNEVLSNINPISDVRSSKAYRIHTAEILTRLILKEIVL